MLTRVDKNHRWIERIALLLALIGMLTVVAGPLIVLSSQPLSSGSSIWPLPALALIDWSLIGILGFFAVYLGINTSQRKWLKLAWFVSGMQLPLIYLGAFSISPFVLISFIFLFVSTLLITIGKAIKWYKSLGLLIFGAVCNLGLLLVFIFLGNPAF